MHKKLSKIVSNKKLKPDYVVNRPKLIAHSRNLSGV